MKKFIEMSCLFLMLITVPAFCNTTKLKFIILDAIKTKCMNQTGDIETFTDILMAVDETSECIANNMVFITFEKEMSRGAEQDELNKVFIKYCNKQDDIYDCFDNLSTLINVCLTEEEIFEKENSIRIFRKFIDFICSGEGDTIAKFFNDDGPSCITENYYELNNCLEKTFSKDSRGGLTLFINKFQQCQDLELIKQCVAPLLKKCNKQTTKLFVQRLLSIYWEELSCEPYNDSSKFYPKSKPNTADHNKKASNVISFIIIFVWLHFFYSCIT